MAEKKPIGFGQAIGNFYARYGIFSGRASRSEYWYSWLYLFLLFLGLVILTFVPSPQVQFIGIIAYWIIGIGHIVPSLAIQARRLRDGGFSPYLTFLLLAPFGGLALFVLAFFPTKPEKETPGDSAVRESGGGIESELKKLAELHEQGLIDDLQLKEAKNRALGI